MSTKLKVVVTAVLFTLVGFALNPNAPLGAAIFGAPDASGPAPTPGQVGALMAVGLVEAVAFGLGAALLAFGLPAVRRVVRSRYAVPVWLAVSWLLVSWVPHTALHMTAGDSIGKLIAIEYAFHVTLVLGGLVLAKGFVAASRPAGSAPGEGRSGRATGDA